MDEEAISPRPIPQEKGIEEDDWLPYGIDAFVSPGQLIKKAGTKVARALPSMAKKAAKPTAEELKKVNQLVDKLSPDELQAFYKNAREMGYPKALQQHFPDPVKQKKVAKELAPDEVRVYDYSQKIQTNKSIKGPDETYKSMSGPTSKDVSQYIEKIKRN